MTVGSNIRRIRREKELTLEQVSAETGINTGNLSRIERDQAGFSQNTLRTIAKALGVTVVDLHQDDQAKVREVVAAYGIRGTTDGDDALVIPMFNVRASMGAGIEHVENETVLNRLELSMSWVRSRLPAISSFTNLAFITGYGDSMEGTYADGDILFVDRGVADVKLDAVYVFRLGDELFIKRLQRLPNGSLKVISDNRKYEPYVLDGDARAAMQILGRVVWAWNGKRL